MCECVCVVRMMWVGRDGWVGMMVGLVGGVMGGDGGWWVSCTQLKSEYSELPD